MWRGRSNRDHSGPWGERRGGMQSRNSYKISYRQPIVPGSVGDAKFQIDQVLTRWGFIVNRTMEDRNFVRNVKDATADCFNRNLLKGWEMIDTSVMVPQSVEEAMRVLFEHILKQVTKDGTKTTVLRTVDALKEDYGVHIPFPPFNEIRGEYRLSRAYKDLGVSEEELHPFKRFSYEERDIANYMLEEFSTEPGDELPSHFVRSLCIFEAVNSNKNVTCTGCKAKGSLLWNSSLRADFCHLVCGECSSVYTLSSVASCDAVQKLFEKKTQFRGSYAHYHEVKHHIDSKRITGNARAKMFFIFISRSFEDEKLPVYVAEIKGAAPNLNTDCFYPERIRIKTNVLFEPLLGGQAWFKVSVPSDIDIRHLSMEVFHKYFDEVYAKNNSGSGIIAAESTYDDMEGLTNQMSLLELMRSSSKANSSRRSPGQH